LECHLLTESLKIRILIAYNELGPRWTEISRRLDVDSDTARAFINRYEKSGTLHPKMGRPIKITQEIKDGIVGVVKFEQEITNLDLIPVKIIHNAC
jgi:transposase